MWDPPHNQGNMSSSPSEKSTQVLLISRNSSSLLGYFPKMRVISRSQKSVWWSGVLLLSLFLFSCSFADHLSQDLASKCTEKQFTCHCGVPTCIEKSLVKDGEKDCADGSDEGQWDPSKCAIKNRTSEDIRFKRAAIPEFSRLSASDATTTFFGNERGRTRPVGLLSTSLGAFVTSGTTTEYLTKILGTYIKGTYARIISTSSRVYHAVPTQGVEIKPTGFVASALSTEINGYATTVHTTDYYRTYIDGTYAQLVSSSSNVQYPSWYTEQIDPSATLGLYTSTPGVITPSSASDHSTGVYATVLPHELRGNFVNNVMQSKAFAELGIVESGDDNDKNQNRIRALRPNNNADNELRVTGTHGKFVHSDASQGGETTYNVFTGSYIQNLKTFLFFFGNTVINPTKTSGNSKYKATLMVENGPQRLTNVHVDMSRNLKVIVPSKNSRVMVDGSVNGEKMEGVLVEIEGSEGNSQQDELITVDGAKAMGTPSDPRIDMITVTLDSNKKTRVSSSSSSSSSSKKDQENEIPQGRKVPSDETNSDNPSSYRLIRPSRTQSVSLPTFTVGQPDKQEFEEDITTPRVVVNVERNVDSSKSKSRGSAPVFQKVTIKPVPRSTERIRALGYSDTKNNNNGNRQNSKSSKYSNMPNRNHRAFAGFDAPSQFNDVDSDLQSAASTGRATVTYVGFADFTTTVGNTVIVFMPRTKMIEDLSVHATKTESPKSPVVEPTRFVYKTDDDEATTQRHNDDDSEHVQFSVSHHQGRKVGSSVQIKIVQDEEYDETTTEINPSESVVSVSGRQTVFIGGKKNSKSSEVNPPEATPVYRSSSPKVRPSASASPSASDRRNSLFSSPRVKFTPKASRPVEFQSSKIKEYLSSPVYKSPSQSVYQTASTAVFQTDVLNPTGLVTSVDGTIVRDGKTTLYTSLVFGTFIGKSYAQVIKSTSKVIKNSEASVFPSFSSSAIRPTPAAKFSTRPSSSVFTDEVSTTSKGSDNYDDEEETTTIRSKDLDRMEVSVSSTTENSNKKIEDDIFERTTLGPIDLEDSFDDELTTTTEKNQDESENEVRRRKVQGKAKDQIIVDAEDFTLEATPVTPGSDDEEEQTIHVTRTLPTTVYRTYTYYTTYFIPKEDSTLTSVVSREVTSSAVGLVRKTFTSIIPTASSSDDVKPSKEIGGKVSSGKFKPSRGKVQPSGAQVIYKTLFTTYTYLTTFFSGQTSSVSSREETISNVQTVTSGIGSKATHSVKITPTGSLRSRSYKTATPRLSSVSQGGKTNVGLSSPSPPRGPGRSSVVRRPKNSKPSVSVEDVELSATDVEYESVTKTLLKTFMTTYTYFTTLFNGDETSIKSRTEVITNVVPYVTKTIAPITPSASADLTSATVAPGLDDEEYDDEDDNNAKDEFSSSTAFRMSNNSNKKVKETTFYTTYTYLSTIFQGKSSTVKTSKQTYTNVIIGDKTIRSGMIEPIEPTKLSGRSAGAVSKSATNSFNDDDEDLNEVGSHLSETSETTVKNKEDESTTLTPRGNDYYELESSEGGITTTTPGHNLDDEDDNDLDSGVNEKTPVLRTLFTTFTFYTTFYKGGTSTVSSRLETKSQIVTDKAGLPEEEDVTITDNAALLSTIDPTFPVTYFTTYTYWTTSFKDGNSIVTSREETVTNVVTPGADEIAPSSSTSIKETDNEIVPTSSQEVELTTFYTTYTYFTTSYLGEKTIVNSRLETVTNVVTGTATSVAPTQTGRAIGTIKPEEQKVTTQEKDEYQDYDLPTGLLSTVVYSEVNDRTTTLYSTDVYGTYIDGIYAQVLESTSNVISPTAAAETRFIPDATATPTGVVSVNEGKTAEAGGDRTTYYATTAYGTLINGKYAHLVESTSSTKVKPGATLEASEDSLDQKTGLVRVIDGTLVEGDRTTFYTSSILGTFIDGNYAQVIESTSRYVISPTKSNGFPKSGATRTVIDVESSITESPQEDEETTTTGSVVEQEDEEPTTPKKGLIQSKRFGLNNRNRGSSRLSFTGTSKTFTPAITPFASRSRPAVGFVPRRRQSSAIIVTKTDDVTPTVTATPSGTTSARGFQSRRRFQKPGDSSKESPVGDGTTTPTPALPASRTRGGSRFSKPAIGVKSRFSSSSAATITPTSTSGAVSGGSSPGARGRSSFARGSSVAGSRGKSSSATFVPPVRGSSSAGFRGTGASSSSRFSPRGRGTSAFINPSATQSTTVKPTQSSSLSPDEEEYEAEYEYETAASSSTTPAPKTTSRFGGGSNRFRLSPKLATPSVDAKTTTARPSTTRGAPNLRGRFSKPTLPTRGTTPAASSSTAASDSADTAAEEYEEEYEEVKDTSSTTVKPQRASFGSGKRPAVVVTQRPTYKPTPRSRATTTGAPATTTTRKIYTPRPRPAGFPRAVGLTRSSTTSTTPAPLGADEEYYEEGEFEYQETKNLPNITLAATGAASEISEVMVPPPAEVGDLQSQKSLQSKAENSDGDLFGSSSDILESILQAIPISSQNADSLASDKEVQDYQENPSGSSRRRRRALRSTRQVDINAYHNYHYNFGARTARGTLRSNFPSRPSSSSSNFNSNSDSNSRSSSTNSNSDNDYEYYYDDGQPAQPPAPSTTVAPPKSPSARFRGRIQPTSASATNSNRRTPFTLTPNSNTKSRTSSNSPSRTRTSSSNSRPTLNSNSKPNTPSRSFIPTRRSQSRYQKPTEPPLHQTTSRTSRFRTRYNSRDAVTTPAPVSTYNSRSRFGNTLTRGRGTTSARGYESVNNNEPVFELSTITVTHYVPAETQIPFVNGKSTEYKTITTPSPSVEILAPHQYTQSDYLGKAVLVLNSEMTSTPSFGVTEITRFVIRESATTTVTFTPTTIRGRKTSFSHIIPSTVYSVEPVVSTITGNTLPLQLQDNSQLTNLLLNQLLGQGFLNPNLLGSLQQQQPLLNINPNEPATPVTQYNTKTTMYVTTVTDFTSTIVKITLHGKPLKSTIVESSTHVITATEFITESTVITPTQVQQQPLTQQPQLQLQQPGGINPALLQSLLASQLALQQQQFLQQPIVPTQPVTLPLQTQQPQNAETPKNIDIKANKDKEQFDQGEESVKDEQKVQVQNTKSPDKPSNNGVPAGSTVITLYISGKNPGQFSTVLQTVAIKDRNKRSVSDANANPSSTISPSRSHLDRSTSTLSIADSFVDSFDDFSEYEDAENVDSMPVLDHLTLNKDKPIISFLNDNNNHLDSSGTVVLEDSYSYSDPFTNLVTNGGRNSFNNGATESLDSVLGDFSNLNSQSVSN